MSREIDKSKFRLDNVEFIGETNPSVGPNPPSLIQHYGIGPNGTIPDGYGWFRISCLLPAICAEKIAWKLSQHPIYVWNKGWRGNGGTVKIELVVQYDGSPDDSLQIVRETAEKILREWPAALYEYSENKYMPPVVNN